VASILAGEPLRGVNWGVGVTVGSPEIVVPLLALVAVCVWAAVDAAGKPAAAWQRSGQDRALWIAAPLVGMFLCGVVGLITAIVYFIAIRPKVVAAAGPPS
jgi:hypothetical protein